MLVAVAGAVIVSVDSSLTPLPPPDPLPARKPLPLGHPAPLVDDHGHDATPEIVPCPEGVPDKEFPS